MGRNNKTWILMVSLLAIFLLLFLLSDFTPGLADSHSITSAQPMPPPITDTYTEQDPKTDNVHNLSPGNDEATTIIPVALDASTRPETIFKEISVDELCSLAISEDSEGRNRLFLMSCDKYYYLGEIQDREEAYTFENVSIWGDTETYVCRILTDSGTVLTQIIELDAGVPSVILSTELNIALGDLGDYYIFSPYIFVNNEDGTVFTAYTSAYEKINGKYTRTLVASDLINQLDAQTLLYLGDGFILKNIGKVSEKLMTTVGTSIIEIPDSLDIAVSRSDAWAIAQEFGLIWAEDCFSDEEDQFFNEIRFSKLHMNIDIDANPPKVKCSDNYEYSQIAQEGLIYEVILIFGVTDHVSVYINASTGEIIGYMHMSD